MSRLRQQRRLLALRREDSRIVRLTTWRSPGAPLSNALYRWSVRVPFKRYWWPDLPR